MARIVIEATLSTAANDSLSLDKDNVIEATLSTLQGQEETQFVAARTTVCSRGRDEGQWQATRTGWKRQGGTQPSVPWTRSATHDKKLGGRDRALHNPVCHGAVSKHTLKMGTAIHL